MTAIGRYIPPFVNKACWRLLDLRIGDKNIMERLEGRKYLAGYSDEMNQRVANSPRDAVGGKWEAIGSLQFNFLKERGILPKHKMLDIGCGTLRGGRHFVRYLNASNYSGIDISPACLNAAHDLIKEEDLEHKTPFLILNNSNNLKLLEVEGKKFDFILAQSVLTHLPELLVRELFENIGECMHDGSAFYYTYFEAKSRGRVGLRAFVYPRSYFEQLAADCGLRLADFSDEFPHPLNQKMGRVTKR